MKILAFDGPSIDAGLHSTGKPFDLAAILGADRRQLEREQVAQRIYRHMDLRPHLALAPSSPERSALSGGSAACGCSMIAALGSERAAGRRPQQRTQVVDQGREAPSAASAGTLRPRAAGRPASTATAPASPRRSAGR